MSAPPRGHGRRGEGSHLPSRVLALTCTAFLASVALGASGEPELRLPPDHLYGTKADSPGIVRFSHATHVALEENRCLKCHPQPFSILGRSRPITHEAMDAGEACGLCHNGNDATATTDSDGCMACHADPAGEGS